MNFYMIIFLIVFAISPLIRCLSLNSWKIPPYALRDIVDYIVHRKWKKFNEYGIHMYIGMFGHGKTLSMSHRARKLYKKFGNSLLFVSNYSLFDIPYVPLKNFNQLMELGEDKPAHYSYCEVMSGAVPSWYYDKDGKIKPEYIDYEKRYYGEDENEFILVKMIKRWEYQATVVLIDEIQSVLSHRNFANFPLELLNVLTQQRKKRVFIMCSAQRFFMVDKIFRGITTFVIDCSKLWRLQGSAYYDAWDYENAMNPQLVRQRKSRWFFVTQKDYRSYSTEQMISRTASEDFLSNEEKLARLGLDNVVNEAAIKRPSRRLKRQRKNRSIA